MKTSFTINGFTEYIEFLERQPKEMNLVARSTLAEIGTMLQSGMISRVPTGKGINTEKLKEVINIKTPTKEGDYNYIWVGVIHELNYTSAHMAIHANIVEFGSIHSEAHPFIRPTIYGMQSQIQNLIRTRLQAAGLID